MKMFELAVFLIFCQLLISQTDSLSRYYPLNQGNEWLFKKTVTSYDFMQPQVATESYFFRTVTGDTVIDERRYAVIEERECETNLKRFFFERFDTTDGTFFRRTASTEEMLDSVLCTTPEMLFDGMKMRYLGSASDTFFGSPTNSRTTQLNVTGATVRWSFSYGIGITKETDWSQDVFFGSNETHSLVFASINGKQYGTMAALIGDSLSLYHPLQIGNRWIYRVTVSHYPSSSSYYFKDSEIISDTLVNNRKYFLMKTTDHTFQSVSYDYHRFDQTTGNYYIGLPTEDLRDSTFLTAPYIMFGLWMVDVVSADTVFGIPTMTRTIGFAGTHMGDRYSSTFAYGFGMISDGISGDILQGVSSTSGVLQYAVINGTEYGTNPLSVNNESHIVPEDFVLFQNYPNPFNPSTTISFSVPVTGARHTVSLRIFDMLGRDIRTLVNEPLPTGRHTVRFDATGLATGLYFYHIQSGTFADTKKMMYLK